MPNLVLGIFHGLSADSVLRLDSLAGDSRRFGGASKRAGIYSEHLQAEKCSPQASVRYPAPGTTLMLIFSLSLLFRIKADSRFRDLSEGLLDKSALAYLHL
jgi:hypothetical protein